MDTLIQDLRYAARFLARTPGFTVIAIITLALGIAVNTSIFSVVQVVLLRPLPYKQADRLVMLWEKDLTHNNARRSVSYPDFVDWRQQNKAFEDLAAFKEGQFTISGSDGPELVGAVAVSSNFFHLLGVEAAKGGVNLPDMMEAGGDFRGVVLSHHFWSTRLGSDVGVIGRPLKLGKDEYTIIGILPASFRPLLPGLSEPELWVPLTFPSSDMKTYRWVNWFTAIARLKSDVSAKQAQVQMDTIAERLARQYPAPGGGRVGVDVVPLHEELFGEVQQSLFLLLGATGLVLLIACANIAFLHFVRCIARDKEIAVRIAIGAGRLRLIRQLLTESVLLSSAGGGLGLLLVISSLGFVRTIGIKGIPRIDETGVDVTVCVFAVVLSFLTGIVFGLLPAFWASRLDLTSSLKTGPAAPSAGRTWLRSLFPIFEIALSLVLLTGAGLFMASFLKLRSTNPGFRSENILTMQISSLSQSQEGSQQQASLEEILARIGALPQVESVGIVNNLPLAGGVGWGRFDFKKLLEQPTTADLTRPIEVDQRIASPGYFGTLGIPFLKGRTFSEDAASGVVQEIIMSKSLAQRLWPDGNAIGRRLRGPRSQPWVPVVGIVGDIRHSSLKSDPRFTLYRAYSEQRYGTLVVRTKSDPLSVAADVRKIILSADKNTLIFQVRSMEEILADSVAQPRFYASLTGLFATLALLMAAVGVYGVISYSVGRRMKEFGIRIALGAEPSSILGIVIREGVVTTVIGIVMGIALSLAVTRLLSNQLFGVAPEDPRIFGLTSLILMLSALAACWVPAWRAARVDPAITLRCE